MCSEPVLNGCLPPPPPSVSAWEVSPEGRPGAGAQGGPRPSRAAAGRPLARALDRTECWGTAAGQLGPCPHPAPREPGLNTSPHRLWPLGHPPGRAPDPTPLFSAGCAPGCQERQLRAPGWTAAPVPCPRGWRKGTISRSGEATWVLLGPSLLQEPVLEETHNPWSVKKGKKKRLAWLPSSPIGTSSCSVQYLPVLLKPGICPDLTRPTGPLHATLRSHDSSPLLPAPARSWQKPSVAFPPSEQRGPRGARAEGTLGSRAARPQSRHPLPKPAFLQPTASRHWQTTLRRGGEGPPAWMPPPPRIHD